MRLKSIKLVGFKSFVDPTTVHFPSNMCGVVGPNGCGKSNIIDAVRWVMGESSAKHLRGESMTDVIFKGSNHRKPTGQASVELIFDNTDKTVTGEYAAYNEISIRRKLTTDAKNTYFLNGNKCRRRDIMDIFLGTGLGPRSYSIISQGIVSNLIESKPEELRIFIEEAAGISKYKERRRETENRIRRTNENLERLTDLRDEMERQLGHLHRQAQAAEKYKAYKSEERLKKAQLTALKWRDLSQGAESREQAIHSLEVELEAANSELRSADAMMEKDRLEQIEQTDRFNAVQGQFYSIGNEVTRIEETLRHRDERIRELTADLEQTESSWQEARGQMAMDQANYEELKEEQLELEPELEILQAQDESSGDALAQAEDNMQRWQREWEQFSQKAQEPRRIAEVEQSRIQHAEQVLNRLQDRESRLRDDAEGLGGSDDEMEMEAFSEQLTELELQRENAEEALQGCLDAIESGRKQAQETEQQLDHKKLELSTARGRYASLEALHQAAMGQDSGILDWLEASGLSENVRLAEKLRVESGWENAVETVLGDSLQAVCVEGIDAFCGALSTFDQGSLMLAEESKQQEVAGCSDESLLPLSGKIRSGTEYAGLVAGIYCTETLQQALDLRSSLKGTDSIITRDGIWLSRHWLRIRHGCDEQAGLLARQDEMESLTSAIAQLEEDITLRQEALQDYRRQVQIQEKHREEQQHRLSDLNRQYGDVRADLQSRKVRLEQLMERQRHLEEELAECQEQYRQEQAAVGESRLKLQDALDAMEQDNEQRELLQEQKEKYRSYLDNLRGQTRQDKDRLHQLALKQQSVASGLASARAAIDRLSQQTTRLRERRENLQESLVELQEPETDLQAQLEELLGQRLEEEERMREARMALEAVELRLREKDKASHDARQKADLCRGQLEKLRIDWQSVEVRKNTLAEQLKNEQFDLATVLDNLEEAATESQWEQDVNKLQIRIERLGAINLAAIEEYETQSERKSYLDAQDNDLTTALETLENAIRKIDKETRQRFKVTFDKVNLGLQALFPKVFGGGRAYLALTGEDLLSTGVTIMAQPPGKKNSTIHLLSGGEKALTAIALVFAIFQLNPSPFCMLDEVDAPLDDANVGRYANMVLEMSEKVQFIYITHNKIAMQEANQLIGVTMHEPGVSRPVSVDIEQAAEMATM
ncbi:Chromosome partition protein Smc [invertebrate metagenome]|uniref:Chromosome partition protein Smc n=1 Tax=invertebrate metagenome TaxID=1711999 RepID=A0A2H9TC11_9ZZZZ